MKRGIVIFVILLLLVGSVNGVVLDQFQEQDDFSHFVICQDWLIAQTFTAGIGGQLAEIELNLENISGQDLYPTTVSIVNVNSGVPDGSVLGTVFAEDLLSGFNSIDFLAESVFLAAGIQYGIVVSNDDPDRTLGISTQWLSTVTDVYDGGAGWGWIDGIGWFQSIQPPDELMPVETFYDKDAVFRTYMVPEPATILFVSLGVFAIRKKR